MGIVVYWKFSNYLSDTGKGFTFNFNSNQERLHREVELGDHVFAISGYQAKSGFELFLLAHLIVRDKSFNAPGFKYGRYRVWADENRSRYFEVDERPVTPILSELNSIAHFAAHEARKYAYAFQTIRKLSEHDVGVLKQFAETLRVHPLSGYRFPEKEFEESVAEDRDVLPLIAREQISDGAKKSYSRRARRSRSLVDQLSGMYSGRCQLCAFDPRTYYGQPLCVGHHIVYFSRGGEDELENVLLLCPNCHEAIHKTNAVFDYRDLAYRFENGRIAPLVLNDHLRSR